MFLFSRSFIRKRAISLATTASVTATSFALAQDRPRTHLLREATPIQYDAQLRRQTDEIVAKQQQEITVMRNAVSEGSRAAQSPELPRAEFSPQSSPIDGAIVHGGMK